SRRARVGRERARPGRSVLRGSSSRTPLMLTPIRTILLAEDNINDIELTIAALRSNNVANEVVVVRDGAAALDYLYRRSAFASRSPEPPGLLLLDLKMPKVDGLEVLQQIKGDRALRTIPIVVLTSSREESDVVRSYSALPRFSVPAAFLILRTTGLDVPFIIISGTIGEEVAVSALKAGAHDFLVKGHLARLFPAIERERREVEGRRDRVRAEDALRRSEAQYRSLVEGAVFGIYQPTVEGRFLTVKPAVVTMLGYDSAADMCSVGVPHEEAAADMPA